MDPLSARRTFEAVEQEVLNCRVALNGQCNDWIVENGLVGHVARKELDDTSSATWTTFMRQFSLMRDMLTPGPCSELDTKIAASLYRMRRLTGSQLSRRRYCLSGVFGKRHDVSVR